MALLFDASTPAAKSTGWIGTATATVASNAFSPPANSLIVVVIEATEGYTSAWNALTVTDNLGTHLSWTVAAAQADQTANYGATWLAWANCPNAQSGMTVSVSLGLTDTAQYIADAYLAPMVFTGADTTAPVVNIQKGTSSVASVSQSIAPIYTGSALLLAVTRYNASATADTAASGCYMKESATDGSAAFGVAWWGSSSAPSATTGGIPETVGVSTADSAPAWQYIFLEVAAPHGTVSPGTGWVTGAVAW